MGLGFTVVGGSFECGGAEQYHVECLVLVQTSQVGSVTAAVSPSTTTGVRMEQTMFKLIQQYELVELAGLWYRPRAFGDRQADGKWDGWLVFFPAGGGRAIAPDRETTQATLDALAVWASSVTPVYLEGALARAIQIDRQPSIIDQLETAEYEALLDADQLEAAAQIDHAAAEAARIEAERLRRERLVTESALAVSEEVAANLDAEVHEAAARESRAAAADARHRSQKAKAAATRPKASKPRTSKKR
jgi:hypothetical protein